MPSTIKKNAFFLKANVQYMGIDIYREILKTKNIKYTVHADSLTIEDYILEQILIWDRSNDYAQMSLHEFLDKINS